mgnify:CR=1 FL=1
MKQISVRIAFALLFASLLCMGAISQTCFHHGACRLQRFRPRAAARMPEQKRRQGRLVYFPGRAILTKPWPAPSKPSTRD